MTEGPSYDDLTCHRARHEDGGWYCAAHGRSWPCAAPNDLNLAVEAAKRQQFGLRAKQIAHLAQLLANTREDGIEGEWAQRLWAAGVRVNRFQFAEED